MFSGLSPTFLVFRYFTAMRTGYPLKSTKEGDLSEHFLTSFHGCFENFFPIFEPQKEYADFSNGIKAPMQVTNKYAIENNIPVDEIFQIAISQYTKNADKLAIEEEISNFLFFDTFFTNRFTGNFLT